MKNLKPLLKRVCAYAIDLAIILIISSLISSLSIFNKEIKEYQKTYTEYEKKYEEYAGYLTLLEESYKDEKIDDEEYVKLIEEENFQEIISSKYKDNKISKKEYKEIISEINKDFDKMAKDYVYLLGTKSITNSAVTLICTLLYFGVIQYFLKGQTVGKKLLKLRVVSSNDGKLNIFTYILRSLIVNEVLLNTVGVLFIAFASKKVYMQTDNIINTLISVVEAVIIFLVLTREDQRGLHDLLFKTKVISTEEPIEEPKEIKVEEPRKKVTTKREKTTKKVIDAKAEEQPKKKTTKKSK